MLAECQTTAFGEMKKPLLSKELFFHMSDVVYRNNPFELLIHHDLGLLRYTFVQFDVLLQAHLVELSFEVVEFTERTFAENELN